jgi:hypothetical protein
MLPLDRSGYWYLVSGESMGVVSSRHTVFQP